MTCAPPLPDGRRAEVDLFYSKGAVGDVVASINRKADEAERAVKGTWHPCAPAHVPSAAGNRPDQKVRRRPH